VVCVYRNGGNKTTESSPVASGNTASEQSATKALDQPQTVEYLEEPTRRIIGGGYYAHVLIKPMTRKQLEALGQILISKMRRLGADHLKAWVYYSRADYAIKRCALWMNATRPDYKLRMIGSVPETTTPQGLFEAYVAFQPMLERQTGKESVWCEYDPKTSTLVYHDRWVGLFVKRLHMPAIVLAMTSRYLPPDMGYPCWTSIPGLKRVVVHHYEKNATEPVATISFGRNAFDQSVRLSKAMYDKEPTFSDIEFNALKRRRAKVMSDDEYRAIGDSAARQMYKLREDLWVEVSLSANIQLHRELPKAPPEFYRRYFFGGK